MRLQSRLRAGIGTGLAVGAAALTLAACGSNNAGGGGSTTTSPTNTTIPASRPAGGIATFAEGVQAPPNFIFPFSPLAYFSVTNLSQFQDLMYRPLYWFGQNGQPVITDSLSLASEPTYSGNTATITMKGYKWSNGEPVDAQDVVFWMNMVKTEPENWAGFSPGEFPQNIVNVTAPNSTTVVFTLDKHYNSTWFTYNELSQITPMPMAWDITSAGGAPNSGGCAKASFSSITIASPSAKTPWAPISASAKACDAVYKFLAGQAGYNPTNPSAANGELSSYATNPVWQIVDGPWHLSSFDATGKAVFVPNPSYTGPVKAVLKEFVELPYQSSSAEFNALLAGQLDVGGLPSEDITSPAPNPTTAGANNPKLAANYNLVPAYGWGINYFPYNFNSNGDNGQAGKIFHQLYFRQAFQSLVDQPLYNKEFFKNYAIPTYGPVPVLPKNPFSDAYEQANPYPYNVANAKQLLSSNGWTVNPGGTSVCNNAAKCGVPVGTQLNFTLLYVGGSPTENELMQTEQSSWAQAGIHISLTQGNFNEVIGNAVACTPSQSACKWELDNWGGGWIFSPDYYPTGDEIFSTGAGSNSGSYSDPVNDQNTLATYTSDSPAAFSTYEDYLAKNLPVVWQPEIGGVNEIAKNLAGVLPLNPMDNITPENWYFTSNPRTSVP